VAAGVFAFGEAYPAIQGFFNATPMGSVTLPQLLGLRYGLVVFLVVVMALAAFRGAEALERRAARRQGA
jgi:hypothetical protein